jgi:hypothetical protein
VDQRLAETTGVRLETVTWSARREQSGVWLVELSFVSQSRRRKVGLALRRRPPAGHPRGQRGRAHVARRCRRRAGGRRPGRRCRPSRTGPVGAQHDVRTSARSGRVARVGRSAASGRSTRSRRRSRTLATVAEPGFAEGEARSSRTVAAGRNGRPAADSGCRTSRQAHVSSQDADVGIPTRIAGAARAVGPPARPAEQLPTRLGQPNPDIPRPGRPRPGGRAERGASAGTRRRNAVRRPGRRRTARTAVAASRTPTAAAVRRSRHRLSARPRWLPSARRRRRRCERNGLRRPALRAAQVEHEAQAAATRRAEALAQRRARAPHSALPPSGQLRAAARAARRRARAGGRRRDGRSAHVARRRRCRAAPAASRRRGEDLREPVTRTVRRPSAVRRPRLRRSARTSRRRLSPDRSRTAATCAPSPRPHSCPQSPAHARAESRCSLAPSRRRIPGRRRRQRRPPRRRSCGRLAGRSPAASPTAGPASVADCAPTASRAASVPRHSAAARARVAATVQRPAWADVLMSTGPATGPAETPSRSD